MNKKPFSFDNIVGEKRSFTVTDFEIDYLSFVGDVTHLDSSKNEHNQAIVDIFKNIGLEVLVNDPKRIYAENKDFGIRAFYSTELGFVKGSSIPKIVVHCSGHYFIHKNAVDSIRNLARFLSSKFGTIMKVSRVDIKRDIIGAKSPFDYLPNFREKEAYWHLRSKGRYREFFNNGITAGVSGFSLSTSRYMISSYDKQAELADKNRRSLSEPHLKKYCEYYANHFRNNSVQRLEVRLKHDACKVFALLFFNSVKSMDEILEIVMAQFSRNHALKLYGPGGRESKKIDPVFAELFNFEGIEEYRIFRREVQERLNIKISDFTFSEGRRSLPEHYKSLAKKLCYLASVMGMEAEQVVEMAKNEILHYMGEFSDLIDRKKEFYEKTLTFLGMNYSEICNMKIRFVRMVRGPDHQLIA